MHYSIAVPVVVWKFNTNNHKNNNRIIEVINPSETVMKLQVNKEILM